MSLIARIIESTEALAALGTDDAAILELPDAALLAASDAVAAHRRHVDALAAWIAGELARRSSRDTGYEGLAQRAGFGSAEALLRSRSPLSRPEAARLVEQGTLMATAADAQRAEKAGNPAAAPLAVPAWQRAIGEALASGSIAIAAADAIRRGLDGIDDTTPSDALVATAHALIDVAASSTLEELQRAARAARDLLDPAGIADREERRRAARYLKRWIRDDGMYAGAFLLDPEAGRIVFNALDAVTAPRRGGPRFVDAAERRRRDELERDERTDDQLRADAFVDMVRLATDADPGTLFGSTRPAVRYVITAEAASAERGAGNIEGDPQPIARETVERTMCDTGVIGVMFDGDGQVLNVGRTRRLFTARQRIALAIRDGGCLWPGCDRPPAYCEAHHIVGWCKDGGRTDVADGVLLCRHHHLLLHNNTWRIRRDGARYFLIPPRTVDPTQRPRPLESKAPPRIRAGSP